MGVENVVVNLKWNNKEKKKKGGDTAVPFCRLLAGMESQPGAATSVCRFGSSRHFACTQGDFTRGFERQGGWPEGVWEVNGQANPRTYRENLDVVALVLQVSCEILQSRLDLAGKETLALNEMKPDSILEQTLRTNCRCALQPRSTSFC